MKSAEHSVWSAWARIMSHFYVSSALSPVTCVTERASLFLLRDLIHCTAFIQASPVVVRWVFSSKWKKISFSYAVEGIQANQKEDILQGRSSAWMSNIKLHLPSAHIFSSASHSKVKSCLMDNFRSPTPMQEAPRAFWYESSRT